MSQLSSERALELINEALLNVWQSGLIPERLDVNDATVVLGAQSTLDSLAFVTFVTDLEDAVSKELGREVPLSMTDLPEGDDGAGGLTVLQLQAYLRSL